MSIFNPPKTIDEYLNNNSGLTSLYRKTGYDRTIDRESNKLAEKIYKLVKKFRKEINAYQKVFKEIVQATGAKENEDIHKRCDFEDNLDKYKNNHPHAVNFIKTFFESLDELEDYYKAEYNPLPDKRKEEILADILNLQE